MHKSELAIKWEVFLICHNDKSLLSYLKEHPESMEECKHHYPENHRICDILLADGYYRVSRCAACGERLCFTIIPADAASPGASGIPYWVSGVGLRKWIEEEKEYQQKLEQDQEKYYDDDHGEHTDWSQYVDYSELRHDEISTSFSDIIVSTRSEDGIEREFIYPHVAPSEVIATSSAAGLGISLEQDAKQNFIERIDELKDLYEPKEVEFQLSFQDLSDLLFKIKKGHEKIIRAWNQYSSGTSAFKFPF